MKTDVIFNAICGKYLADAPLIGTITDLTRIFPGMGREKWQDLQKKGIISTIPNTDKFIIATVLYDLIDKALFNEIKPQPIEQSETANILKMADTRASELVASRKHHSRHS